MCVEFPTHKPPSTGGPPHASPPKVWEAHLTHPGMDLPYNAEGDLQEEEVAKLSPKSPGLQRLAHWRPNRTNQVDQNTDFVSIWGHVSV